MLKLYSFFDNIKSPALVLNHRRAHHTVSFDLICFSLNYEIIFTEEAVFISDMKQIYGDVVRNIYRKHIEIKAECHVNDEGYSLSGINVSFQIYTKDSERNNFLIFTIDTYQD